MKIKSIIILLYIAIIIGCKTEDPLSNKEFLYVGTFSERNSEGLYVFEVNRDSLYFCLMQTIPQQVSPSFLEIHPSKKYLYTVCRKSINDSLRWGSVSAFTINSLSGTLELINEQSSYGKDPCHISIDNSGKYVFVSNYSEGNLSVYSVKEDGSLSDSIQTIRHIGKSINEHRQERPHIHSAIASPDNRFVYVSDLGTDKVVVYALEDNGRLTRKSEVNVMQGAGPRHLVLNPKGDFAFLSEELRSTVCVFSVNKETGALIEMQRIPTIPSSFNTQNTNADIHISPDGNFVYVSNRGHNSIAAFSVDSQANTLQLIEYESTRGKRPRNFMIDHTGNYLFAANRDTDTIEIFNINKTTGALEYAGISISVPSPVCLKTVRF